MGLGGNNRGIVLANGGYSPLFRYSLLTTGKSYEVGLWGLGSRVQGLGFNVWGLEFRVYGLRFMIQLGALGERLYDSLGALATVYIGCLAPWILSAWFRV